MSGVSQESPQSAARRLAAAAISEGFAPRALYEYQLKDGSPWCWRIRCEHPDGRKWIRPMCANGQRFAIGEPEAPKQGKPLYRLPELVKGPKEAPVWIVEGEKCADALAALGLVATTSGASSSAAAADWSPIKGRNVIIWPDYDEAGARYANDVVSAMRGSAAACEMIEVPVLGLPEHGDCVDWLAANEGATAEAIESLARKSVDNSQRDERPLVTLMRASDVQCQPIQWLWAGWLAKAKLHILAGAPGTGKTSIALTLAAAVSSGRAWPSGGHPVPGNVLIWSGEDDVADTLAPRLKAAKANLDRIYFVRDTLEHGEARPFDPAFDLKALEQVAAKIGDVALLIADPVVSAVSGDSHKNTEVRRALQPLVDFGARLGCAVLGITHFSKGTSGRDPTERVTGSVAFGALARVVLVTAKQEENRGEQEPEIRLLARAKSNIGPDGGGFSYALEQVEIDGISASKVVWGAPLDGSARELLGEAESADSEERSATDEAEEWLLILLRSGGMKASELQKQARDAGISDKALRRARERLGIKPKKSSFGGGWEWGLPAEDAFEPRSCPSPDKGILGTLGAFSEADAGSEVVLWAPPPL